LSLPAVSNRVVPLRLCGFDRGTQREVVLPTVYSSHEEEGKPAQINAKSPGPTSLK